MNAYLPSFDGIGATIICCGVAALFVILVALLVFGGKPKPLDIADADCPDNNRS